MTGGNWFWVYQCRSCGRYYCYQCRNSESGKRCPHCYSEHGSEHAKVYKDERR